MSTDSVDGVDGVQDSLHLDESDHTGESLNEGGPEAADDRALREAVVRDELGPIRAYFKTRPARYWSFQRRLDQARRGETYDAYLARAAVEATLAGFLGALLGLIGAFGLAETGILAGIQSPESVPTGLAAVVAEHRLLVAGGLLVPTTAGLSAAAVWMWRRTLPAFRADSRRRAINVTLPHAIVYMYALSFGGLELMAVIRRMAAAEETYGEVAAEFDTIVRDVDVFGNDLFTAIRNTRNLTPSDNMESFLDDLLSVLDSGGDLSAFLDDESAKYMREARDEQDRFLDTLATLAEVFVVAFVATPLFLVVTLMMLSLLGGATVVPLMLVVYAVVPLGMAGFIVTIAVLSEPYVEPGHEVQLDDRTPSPPPAARGHPAFRTFRRLRRQAAFRELLSDPAATFRRRPAATLVLTLPVAGLLLGGIHASGIQATPAAVVARPLVTAVALFVVPFLVVTVPLAAFHEVRRRRRVGVAKRLPDALDVLASANRTGVSLAAGLELVAGNQSGRLAVELERVRNDIRWKHDIRAALLGLADRLRVPQLTRTCKILAEGSRSTGDLHRVIDIAAEDTRHRYRLARDRARTLSSYTVIVIVGFLVYLGVVVVIDQSFLAPIAGQVAGADTAGPIGIDAGTVAIYHALFIHAALVQAIGTGLISGKLADNSVLTGLKYSIALVLVAVAVFALL